MGKNQAYKAMQRSRLGSSSAGPEEVEDGMMDGSFHSPEWHAARLASLKTSHTITWEEYKKKQKEDELRKGELEADKDKMMREYRAQLDAERATKLALGRNHSGSKSNHKKEKRDKDLKKRSSKKRKRGRSQRVLEIPSIPMWVPSIHEGSLQSQAPPVHHLNLPAVTRKENLGDQSQGQRGQKKKGSTDQRVASILAVIVRRKAALCHSLDSLGVQRAETIQYSLFHVICVSSGSA